MRWRSPFEQSKYLNRDKTRYANLFRKIKKTQLFIAPTFFLVFTVTFTLKLLPTEAEKVAIMKAAFLLPYI